MIGRMPRRMRSERGVAAVEFALVLLPLLLIVFGIIAFGRAYGAYESYVSAAREGARFAAVQCATVGSVTTGCTDQAIRDRISAAAYPYVPSFTGFSAGVCTQGTVGDEVAVSWVQDVPIDLYVAPPLTAHVTVKGVFRCE